MGIPRVNYEIQKTVVVLALLAPAPPFFMIDINVTLIGHSTLK